MSGLTDRLRQVAGQATPGPWWHDDARDAFEDSEHFVASEQQGRQVCSYWGDPENTADAEHIATFDPVLVGAMLDVIDAADAFDRISCEEWDHGMATKRDMAWWDDWEQRRARQLDALNAALARFREVAG